MTNDECPNDERQMETFVIRHSSIRHLHWGVQDSNLRRHKPSDLQSDPFDRFGNSPRHEQLSVEPPRRGPTRRNTLVPANSRYYDRRSTKTGALRATSRDGPNTSASH